MKTTFVSISIIVLFLWSGCSQEIIEPEFFGTIEGTVVSSSGSEGVLGVSIETSPATDVILTGKEGDFTLSKVPVGKYVITAHHTDFGTRSVNVMVREDEVTSAKIVLEPKESELTANLQAAVSSWVQRGEADSSFVEVEYSVRNTGSSTVFNQFEIYFDIHNNQETLFYEIADTSLNAGESSFGSFTKFVRNAVVDSVVVSGKWVSNS